MGGCLGVGQAGLLGGEMMLQQIRAVGCVMGRLYDSLYSGVEGLHDSWLDVRTRTLEMARI